jgi:uncharacterized RDD family membrane protein YckC
MTYAGFWKRVVALLIDSVIVVILLIPIALLSLIDSLVWVYYVGSISLNWLYFAFFESSGWRATPGKKLLKINVVNLNGDRISFARATGRYFAKFFSAIILGIGYLMAAFTRKKQALHDIIADTLVITDSKKEITGMHVDSTPAVTQTIIVNRNESIAGERLVLAGFDSTGHVVRLSFNFEDPKLYQEGLYLGRDSANCDLHIKDQSISRRHARIYKIAHEIWIEDLGSTNGIIVNGKSLTSGESALLNLQGTLAIGGIQLALGKD